MIPKRGVSLWPFFQASGLKYGLDPLLLLAVCDRESLCGKTLAEDGTGDNHNGLGLMQLDRRWHPQFAAMLLPDGTPAWKDPAINIDEGARVLSFGLKVFGKEDAAVASYNAGVRKVANELDELTVPGDPEMTELIRRHRLDEITTGGNYVSDVLGRREAFRVSEHTPSKPPPPKPKGVR
jgi:soluble lytic murein transglycosylase-like protein